MGLFRHNTRKQGSVHADDALRTKLLTAEAAYTFACIYHCFLIFNFNRLCRANLEALAAAHTLFRVYLRP